MAISPWVIRTINCANTAINWLVIGTRQIPFGCQATLNPASGSKAIWVMKTHRNPNPVKESADGLIIHVLLFENYLTFTPPLDGR